MPQNQQHIRSAKIYFPLENINSNGIVFQKYILHLIGNVYDRLGFTGKTSDSRLDIYLRMLITEYACKYGHEQCISDAKLEFAHMETSSTYK